MVRQNLTTQAVEDLQVMTLTTDLPIQDQVVTVQEVLVQIVLLKEIPTRVHPLADHRVTLTALRAMTTEVLLHTQLLAAAAIQAQDQVREEVVVVHRHLVDQAQVVDLLEDQDNI